MIQQVVIDDVSMRYYEYLDQKYREIVKFLQEKDGSLNPEKLQMFFERTTSPFKFWLDSNNSNDGKTGPVTPISEEGRENLLKALCKKYNIAEKGGKYTIMVPLDSTKFNELREKMKGLGYQYDKGAKGFLEVRK